MENNDKNNIQKIKNLWRKQSWTLADLRGGKQAWFTIVTNLLKLLDKEPINDLNITLEVDGMNDLQPWKSYIPFLKNIGLVDGKNGGAELSSLGKKYVQDLTKKV